MDFPTVTQESEYFTESTFSDNRFSVIFNLKQTTAANFYPCIDDSHKDNFKRGVFCGLRRIYELFEDSGHRDDKEVISVCELELILNTQHWNECGDPEEKVFFDGLRTGNAKGNLIVKEVFGEVF